MGKNTVLEVKVVNMEKRKFPVKHYVSYNKLYCLANLGTHRFIVEPALSLASACALCSVNDLHMKPVSIHL